MRRDECCTFFQLIAVSRVTQSFGQLVRDILARGIHLWRCILAMQRQKAFELRGQFELTDLDECGDRRRGYDDRRDDRGSGTDGFPTHACDPPASFDKRCCRLTLAARGW